MVFAACEWLPVGGEFGVAYSGQSVAVWPRFVRKWMQAQSTITNSTAVMTARVQGIATKAM